MAPNLTLLEWALLPFHVLLLILQLIICYLEAFFKLLIPPKKKKIGGQVVLITGAGGGFGRPMALRFADLGAKLVLWDINENSCKETAELVKASGGAALVVCCDVSDVNSVHTAAERTLQRVGHVDILINNAGVSTGGSLIKLSTSEIKRTIDVNLMSHFWVTGEFLPTMFERNVGHVVSIASMAGRVGVPFLTDYCASKWGVTGFTESLTEEVRRLKKDIKFTTVFPMFADTEMVRKQRSRVIIRTKFGDILDADEVAEAIVDGILRNKHSVYIPSYMGAATMLLQLMPKRGGQTITDFLDATMDELN